MLEAQVKVLASIYTALLIAAVLTLLLFGGFKIKTPLVNGQIIEAVMIDISQLKDLTKPQKPTQEKIEPKQEPLVEEVEPEKEPEKEVKKETPPIEKKQPPIIAKKIEPKIDIKAEEIERKKQLDRQKKLKEIRKKRKAAEKRRKIEEQKLKDLASKTKDDGKTTPQKAGNTQGPSDTDIRNQLMFRYQLAVIGAVERQWNKPASANTNLLCHVKVRQIPGGGVINASIASPCNANETVKKSIIAAIQKADPLPYKGFEKVFDRTATFIFQPQD